jgi:hypothetical protein
MRTERHRGPRISGAPHSASKTRVNALMALRRIRGTRLLPRFLIRISNSQLYRHCERSEAIHGAARKVWIASSLRSSQ